MMQEIFLPANIGSYYLFRQRILGIEITKTEIVASKVQLQGNRVTIQNCFSIALINDKTLSLDERIVQTLKIALRQSDGYDQLYAVISSALVIYKELRLPFSSPTQIRQVINFEIEPLLPFSIDQAIIDFIIPEQPQADTVQVFVAAVQKQQVTNLISLFEQAGVTLDKITIDMFALYGFYLQIPTYVALPGNVILVDFGLQITRIACVSNNQLRVMRTLPQGISSCAKQVAEQLELPTSHALDQLMRFGLTQKDNHLYDKAVAQACTQFWKSIQFTLSSFYSKAHLEGQSQLIIFGEGAKLDGIASFVEGLLDMPCHLFDAALISQNPEVRIAQHVIPIDTIISLSAAFPNAITKNINLLPIEYKVKETQQLYKQIGSLICLIFLILSTLIGSTFYQIYSLSHTIEEGRRETLTVLQEQFKPTGEVEQDETVEEAIQRAERELKKNQELWYAFTLKSREQFLKNLITLTTNIDKKTGFKPDQIIMTPGKIIINGRVKNYEALRQFEIGLKKIKEFHFKGQPNPQFSLEIIVDKPTQGVN